MVKIHPFRAIRPAEELMPLVSATAYDSSMNHLCKEIMDQNGCSFLHVVKPHLNFPNEEKDSEKHFPIARKTFEGFMADGILEQEETPVFYIYRQNKWGQTFTGLIAGASVQNYLDQKIKKHEKTRTDKQTALYRHIYHTKVEGNPTLLTYPDDDAIASLIQELSAGEPDWRFQTEEDATQHELWRIHEAEAIAQLEQAFAKLECLYIADGHHRSAAAEMNFKENGQVFSSSDCFLSFILPAKQLHIYEFNRLVTDLNGLSKAALLQQLEQHFEVSAPQSKAITPDAQGHFGMYLESQWYALRFKGQAHTAHVIDTLDVSVLENFILKPVLGIEDSQTDPRLSFYDGTKPIEGLEERVNSGKVAVAFTLFPTSPEEVFEVADHLETMPPKSTWIEPKIRTGLFIHAID